jgi:ATP-dependent protease ClpP protease subunit
MKTWFTITNQASDTAEIRIYNEIGAHGIPAQQFCNALNEVKAAKIALHINSQGGEIFDSMAICSAIQAHPADVTAYIDGVAASCASWIAAACDSTVMDKHAFQMMHNPQSGVLGSSDDMRKRADTLDKMRDAIAQIYADKSGKDLPTVKAAMDAETWFNAAEAKAWGLCDSIEDPDDEEEETDDDGSDYTDSAARSVGGAARYINSLAPLLIQKYRNVPARIQRMAVENERRRSPADSQTQEANAMLKITNRDGKHFVTIDGKEHEVGGVPSPIEGVAAQLRPVGKTDEELAAAVNLAKAEAVKAEREYRTEFDTIVKTSGLTGKSLEDFNNFYGKPIADLKFIATNAMTIRAAAVGESAGAADKKPTPVEAAEAEAGKRFDDHSEVRSMFATNLSDPESAEWKSARGRCVAAARRRFLSINKSATQS